MRWTENTMTQPLDEFDDLFDDGAGDLDIPTMRGNANLDVQDYARFPGESGSTFLDDELQEDVRSTPGSGAGPAPDVDGMSEFGLNPFTADDPGMEMTEFGSYPWGPGGGGGYRPASMRTDLSGDDNAEVSVLTADAAEPAHRPRMHPQRNEMPSNDEVDPSTLYDRTSFEYDDDPQNVIGTGIFDTEEGVVWNARDGVFANDFALPAYIAQEGELDTQQSQMWDSVANNWRVVQPSGGGVTFARNVRALKPTSSPFVDQQMSSMRPERTGPRSHIEAFGRAAAKAVVDEARTISSPQLRSQFLTQATEALGAGQAAKCRLVAERLAKMGFRPDVALEDTLAHCVMNAAMKDMNDRAKGKNGLPRIDRMGSRMRANSGALRQAVTSHIAPIAVDKSKAAADIAALVTSPAAAGMGQVETPEPSAVAVPEATGRNMLIGVAAVGIGYLLLTKTKQGKTVQRNMKRQAKKIARKIGVK
jgi:hypothetical protein